MSSKTDRWEKTTNQPWNRDERIVVAVGVPDGRDDAVRTGDDHRRRQTGPDSFLSCPFRPAWKYPTI